MFINVVQKAKPLFKDFSEVSSIDEAKQLALANPIFSWHVKYLSYKRKKTVIFTNDATTLTVVLHDINASNRSELEERFLKQLADVWKNVGMTETDFDKYCKAAKSWEIGPTINRGQLGRLNEVGSMVELYLEDRITDQSLLSNKATGILRKLTGKEYTFESDIPKIMQKTGFECKPARVLEIKKVDVQRLQEVKDELNELSTQSFDDLSIDDQVDKMDSAVKKMIKLNNEMINSFMESIQDDYSEKTLKSYRNTLTFYLNEYLSYHLTNVFQREASSVGELYLHGSSMTEVKRVQRSKGKFYKFLADNKLVDVDYAKDIKQEMKDDIEMVEMYRY